MSKKMICSMCHRETRADLRYCEYCGAQNLNAAAGVVPSEPLSTELPSYSLPVTRPYEPSPAPPSRGWTPPEEDVRPIVSESAESAGADEMTRRVAPPFGAREAYPRPKTPPMPYEPAFYAPKREEPPVSNPMPAPEPDAPPVEEEPALSVGRMVGLLIFALIPVVGAVQLLLLAFGRTSEAARNLARALLIVRAILWILLLAGLLILLLSDLQVANRILRVFAPGASY